MKILVIFTGGTIGSRLNDGYISPDAASNREIINNYVDKYGRMVEFSQLEPTTILSENSNCNFIMTVAKCVRDNYEGYQGIIITHGSDTIQYTAAALWYTCNQFKIPVMLVCSNYILSDNRANGNENFAMAVDYIVNKRTPGVYVPYANEPGRVDVHRGDLLMPHNMYSHKLYSLEDHVQGTYVNGTYYESNNTEVTPETFPIVDNNREESGVLWINSYPGQNYSYSLPEYKAVLITTYHSGTICTASKSLISFIKKAGQNNIPVYIIGNESAIDYESCRLYDSLGINVLPKMSPIAAYIMLWLK